MTGAAPRVLAGVLALAAGLAFLVLEPEQSLQAAAGRRLGLALLVALAWLGALWGAGSATSRWLRPGGGRASSVAGTLGLGLVLVGLLAGLLAMAGLWRPVVMGGVLALGWLGFVVSGRPVLPRPAPATAAMVILLALVGLVDAAAPPVGTDEIYYQLALPARMLEAGGLVGGPLQPAGSRPMPLHLLYAAQLHQGGEVAVRLFHLGLVAVLLLGVDDLARRWLAPLAGPAAVALLVGSWSFAQQAGLAANDLPTALLVTGALEAALAGELVLLGLLSGGALAVKYTAAGAVAGLFLAARGPLPRRALAGLLALALLLPWWLHNAVQGLHPLFPFAGWPGEFTFQYLDKYGVGRGPLDLLLLPWHAVMSAEIQSFAFLGKLSPAWLALLLPALLALPRSDTGRRLGLVGAVAFAAWAAGPHWHRYLLPALPVLALGAGAGAAWLAEGGGWRQHLAVLALGVPLLLGLPANWGPLLDSAADRLEVATGQEEREDYLARSLDDWETVSWARQRLPADARVALLFAWNAYHLDRDVLIGSVEDHVPTRHLLLTEGRGSLRALREAGATHVLVGQIRFAHRVYPFLDEADFEAQFAEPEALLGELLLREATLLFQHGRHAVYRLEADTPAAGSPSLDRGP